MTSFKEEFSKIFKDLKFSDSQNVRWRTLYTEINQDVLDDAHAQTSKILTLFQYVANFVARSVPKKMDRVEMKIHSEYDNYDKPYLEWTRPFSDFIAIRHVGDPNTFVKIIEEMRRIVKAYPDSVFYVRDSTETRPYGGLKTDNEFTDIVIFVRIYIPSYEYPIEVQLLHPFADKTFSRNSERRDNGVTLPNLFNNKVYANVKGLILYKLNNDVSPNNGNEGIENLLDVHIVKGEDIHNNIQSKTKDILMGLLLSYVEPDVLKMLVDL